MKRLRGESELEGSGVVWSVKRAFNTPRAALRGMRSELGATKGDLGRGHQSAWSANRARGAALRGMRVSFTPSRRSDLGLSVRVDDLGARVSDLVS